MQGIDGRRRGCSSRCLSRSPPGRGGSCPCPVVAAAAGRGGRRRLLASRGGAAGLRPAAARPEPRLPRAGACSASPSPARPLRPAHLRRPASRLLCCSAARLLGARRPAARGGVGLLGLRLFGGRRLGRRRIGCLPATVSGSAGGAAPARLAGHDRLVCLFVSAHGLPGPGGPRGSRLSRVGRCRASRGGWCRRSARRYARVHVVTELVRAPRVKYDTRCKRFPLSRPGSP